MKVTPDAYKEFVATLFHRNEGDLSKDFAHAVLGVTTEQGEMVLATDDVNRLEESGDNFFFCVAGAMVLKDYAEQAGLVGYGEGRIGEHEIRTSPAVALEPLLSEAAEGLTLGIVLQNPQSVITHSYDVLQNTAKKWVGYGAEPDADAVKQCIGAFLTLAFAGNRLASGGDDELASNLAQRIALANIKKLRHRYPKGFNLDDAENRDREGERDALESAND